MLIPLCLFRKVGVLDVLPVLANYRHLELMSAGDFRAEARWNELIGPAYACLLDSSQFR